MKKNSFEKEIINIFEEINSKGISLSKTVLEQEKQLVTYNDIFQELDKRLENKDNRIKINEILTGLLSKSVDKTVIDNVLFEINKINNLDINLLKKDTKKILNLIRNQISLNYNIVTHFNLIATDIIQYLETLSNNQAYKSAAVMSPMIFAALSFFGVDTSEFKMMFEVIKNVVR